MSSASLPSAISVSQSRGISPLAALAGRHHKGVTLHLERATFHDPDPVTADLLAVLDVFRALLLGGRIRMWLRKPRGCEWIARTFIPLHGWWHHPSHLPLRHSTNKVVAGKYSAPCP